MRSYDVWRHQGCSHPRELIYNISNKIHFIRPHKLCLITNNFCKPFYIPFDLFSFFLNILIITRTIQTKQVSAHCIPNILWMFIIEYNVSCSLLPIEWWNKGTQWAAYVNADRSILLLLRNSGVTLRILVELN